MKPILFEDLTCYFECATKFHSFLLVKGLIHSNNGGSLDVKNISFIGGGLDYQKYAVERTLENGLNCYRFSIEVILSFGHYEPNLLLDIELNDRSISMAIDQIVAAVEYLDSHVSDKFFNHLKKYNDLKLLDIGGRARSGLLRASGLMGVKTTVLDILNDDGVDVVADAHDMSAHLKRGAFDACMCISVFEHLIMPWKVVLEINRVMRVGGLCLIATHQTVGMHDMPWDYYRFSADSWDGLFNTHTGFEILDRSMSGLNFIIPFAWSIERNHAEKAAGYESSVVLVKKISTCKMKWPVKTADIVGTPYPQ